MKFTRNIKSAIIQFFFLNKLKSAFTMTEVMIVMTILGVIATIMITTIKPAEYKEKALETASKKVLNSLDHATTMILLNDSIDGKMDSLIATDGTTFSPETQNLTNSGRLANLYKKYLVATRAECGEGCSCRNMIGGDGRNASSFFYLKDGACVGIYARKYTAGGENSANTIFPGESNLTLIDNLYSLIMFDTNGNNEPNAYGKDRFKIPLVQDGIGYNLE